MSIVILNPARSAVMALHSKAIAYEGGDGWYVRVHPTGKVLTPKGSRSADLAWTAALKGLQPVVTVGVSKGRYYTIKVRVIIQCCRGLYHTSLSRQVPKSIRDEGELRVKAWLKGQAEKFGKEVGAHAKRKCSHCIAAAQREETSP